MFVRKCLDSQCKGKSKMFSTQRSGFEELVSYSILILSLNDTNDPIWTLKRCDRTFCKDNEKRCIIQVGGHIDEVLGGELGSNVRYDNPKPYTVRFSPFVSQYAITNKNTIDSKLTIGLIRRSDIDKNRPGLVFGAVSLIYKELWSIIYSDSLQFNQLECFDVDLLKGRAFRFWWNKMGWRNFGTK